MVTERRSNSIVASKSIGGAAELASHDRWLAQVDADLAQCLGETVERFRALRVRRMRLRRCRTAAASAIPREPVSMRASSTSSNQDAAELLVHRRCDYRERTLRGSVVLG